MGIRAMEDMVVMEVAMVAIAVHTDMVDGATAAQSMVAMAMGDTIVHTEDTIEEAITKLTIIVTSISFNKNVQFSL